MNGVNDEVLLLMEDGGCSFNRDRNRVAVPFNESWVNTESKFLEEEEEDFLANDFNPRESMAVASSLPPYRL